MNWQRVRSTEYPDTIDTTSSKVYNYVRRNISEVTEKDSITDVEITYYEYDELKVLKESWELYLDNEANKANIDYIAMMTDVELPESEG